VPVNHIRWQYQAYKAISVEALYRFNDIKDNLLRVGARVVVFGLKNEQQLNGTNKNKAIATRSSLILISAAGPCLQQT
jgi:hypothetical protein